MTHLSHGKQIADMSDIVRPHMPQSTMEYGAPKRLSGFAKLGRLAMRLKGFNADLEKLETIQQPFSVQEEMYDDPVIQAGSKKAKMIALGLYHAPGTAQNEKLFVTDFGEAATVTRIDQHEGDSPFFVPTDSIVAVPDMEKWSDAKQKKHRALVRRILRGGKPLAPVSSELTAYVQPNGRVLYQLANNGGHTVAAAKLRGDAVVQVNGSLLVKQLRHDIVDDEGCQIPDSNRAPANFDPNNVPFASFDPAYARKDLFVLRNARDGEPAYIDDGWREVGVVTENGVQKTRVIKDDPVSGMRYVKLIPTQNLNSVHSAELARRDQMRRVRDIEKS